MVTTERKSAEERREEILRAALVEFAERGLHGASTEEIAKRAGISQPYVFRRSEEHTSELQSQSNLVCRLLLEKKKMTVRCASFVYIPHAAPHYPRIPEHLVMLPRICADP